MGSKMRGRVSAGLKLWVVAARRMSLPERETNWTGRLRERKEGWWRMRWRGGSGGGGGSGSQVEETGSKVNKWIGVEEEFDLGEKRAYRERKGGKEGE